MLSSSTSRRESKSSDLFRAAAMALRDAANKTAGIEPNKAASNNNVATVAAVSIKEAIAAVRHEGWMVRYGRRKIGRSFFHTRYFVLDNRLLAYYKKKPKDNMVPLNSLLIDGNCRVEDRGLKTLHGQMIYVLCIYNKKEKEHQITMGAYDIEDAMAWKKKIELIIDQQQDSMTAKNRKAFASMDFDMELGGQFLFSDHDSTAEDDEERPTLTRKTTIGNGPPDSIHDWTKEPDIGVSNQNDPNQFCSKKNWRLLRCQNGLRIFEELLEVDYPARGCSRAMRAVGVVEATCEAIFGLIMSMDVTRYEWDCSFRNGSLVEEVDGHTAILYHRLHLHWCPMLVWPRDLCYARYWRRNDDGSYVVLFRSTEHLKCGRRRGFVRAFIESGGFKISPLKCRNGRPRTQVQHLMQIDLKGWFLNYSLSFQYHSLLQILNCVAGLCEYFSQTDDIHITPRIPVMESMFDADSEPKNRKLQEFDTKANRNMGMIDEESDDDDDYQVPEANIEEDVNKSHHDIKRTDEPTEKIDLSCFLSILHRDPEEKSRNCWTIPDSKIFKVRSKNFPQDKSKIPAASYLMELAAIDWFKDTKRMDNVARQKGCVAQVAADRGMHTFVVNIQIPGSTQYSLVMYFVTNTLRKGSLLQRFFDGDDEFRNSRLKLIPSVPKGSWIVRQSVGSTPCLLGKAVDCSYVRGPAYLEVDVDIGSSAVANGVLGIVFGVVTTLVVDMAFLIQANTYEELPEQVIGAARLAHVEPATAVVPDLSNTSNDSSNSNNDNNNNNNNNNGSSEDDLSKKTN
ncbi:protein ENHANCED DISEASE RESISTANCE 2 isoform X1 [Zea mays]|uniref:Protein ENHANCED DISEASE RESISTANCE 2 n=1 Tax=Zea mays TaxID=4577 RepID=K7UCM8_MAIZE|nr:protein ENHANCED DISEASE RESISTANCE 2 isoform X1 [Zea mays]AQK61262.1 Protein ENHANCED DISEASE RESISTANCE 2 [Zea mays]|eukprot:XP_008680038.1 protein ENHANCED DISEASE RESISTANCE 2 isoform X1 [Zea mays]